MIIRSKENKTNLNIKIKRHSQDDKQISIIKPKSSPKFFIYKCQFWNYILFNTKDIQIHDSHSKTYTQNFFPSSTGQKVKSKAFPKGSKNWWIFINNQEWITEYDGNAGRILCPRKTCSVKLGVYSWSGLKCAWGVFRSPAFQIEKKAITEMPQFV